MNEIQIGPQIWATENATITKFRNGDDIPFVSNKNEWNELTSPAYCINENNDYLYNYWVIVDSRNIAPTGWRVPNDNDWVLAESGRDSGKVPKAYIQIVE